MITDDKKKALCCCKKIVCLNIKITSNHVGDFYWLNCLHLFRTEKKLKSHEKTSLLLQYRNA